MLIYWDRAGGADQGKHDTPVIRSKSDIAKTSGEYAQENRSVSGGKTDGGSGINRRHSGILDMV